MKSSRTYTLAVLAFNALVFACAARGQANSPVIPDGSTTRPTPIPVLAWDQPASHLPMLAKLGITHVTGPEVPNAKNLAPDALAAGTLAWIKATQDAGLKCILRNPTGPLPPNCAGIMLSADEPNGKGVPPSAIFQESNDLRTRYPGVPILLSLAGDKITSNLKPGNRDYAAQCQLYRDYGALADILTVDWYDRNRNATRYPVTLTGDAVVALRDVTGKPVWAWIECSDQQLPSPTSKTNGIDLDINREPTPDEMQATVDYAIARGASGIGWFATCDSGQYGWTWDDKRGDSYWPLVNRLGVSTQPQIDAIARISQRLAPPTPDPVKVLQSRVAELEQNQRATSDALDTLNAKLNDPATARELLLRALTPATQPTTGGGK
jgi:hypothetical protein